MDTIENLLNAVFLDLVNVAMFVLIFLAFLFGLIFNSQGKHQEFVHSVPTMLTTMGVFGTFFGIVLGLLEFDQGDIQASIPPLLAGLKTAFITSLIGIAFSLLFKLFTSFSASKKPAQPGSSTGQATPAAILSAIEAQLSELKGLKVALVGTEETTLFGQLKLLRSDLNDNARAAVSHANDNTQLVLAQTETHANVQRQAFTSFADTLWLRLHDVTESLSKSATDQMMEALKQVINDFNHNLTEQFGDNFKQLNEAVIKLVAWQEHYKEQLAQMQVQYAQGVQSIGATELAVAHISEQSKVIPESMNELKGIMQVNQHQLAELERHLAAFALMRDEAVKAVPEIQQQVQQTVTDVANAAATASEHYRALLTGSDAYIQSHIKTSNELLEKFARETEKGINNVGQQLLDSSTLIGKEIEQAGNEFTDNTARTNQSLQNSADYLQQQSDTIKQHLQDAVNDLNNNLRIMVETLISDAKEMSQTMKQANEHLVTDTEKMRDSVVQSAEKLQQRISDVIDDSATQQISQAQRTFDAMEEQIRQQVGLTSDAVENQLQLIDKSMQNEIERVIQQMGEALAQVSGHFVNDYTRLTQAMQDIVKRNAA